MGIAWGASSQAATRVGPGRWGRWTRRLVYGAATFFLVDLVLAATIFSVAASAVLFWFAVSWIQLVNGYAAIGAQFGTSAQLWAARGILVVTPPIGFLAVYLGARASAFAKAVWRRGSPSAVSPPPAPVA